VKAEVLKRALAGSPDIDSETFFRDIDSFIDQDPTPRA